MDIETWLQIVRADAQRRGLTALPALLETVARSTERLRRADDALRREEREHA